MHRLYCYFRHDKEIILSVFTGKIIFTFYPILDPMKRTERLLILEVISPLKKYTPA